MAEVKKAKTISIKNKKAAKQTLAKASIKGKKTTKASTVKKKPKNITKDVQQIDEIELLINNKPGEKETKKEVKEKPKTKATKTTKTSKKPTSVKKKVTKAPVKKEILKNEEPKIDVLTDEEKIAKQDLSIEKQKLTDDIKKLEKELLTEKQKKKQEKKKLKEEKRRKKKEKKLKEKEEKKRLKEKEKKEKQKQKELKKKKGKIELPKEWKTINTKNTKIEKNKEEVPKTFKGRLRSSIFESVDEQELEERKRKSRESLKKTIIIFLIIGITIAIIIYSLLKYNDFVRKQLAVYEPYRIGDVVKLKDESRWFVVSDSDSREETVKIISQNMIDINSDGIIDSNDYVVYNSTGKAEYDISDEYTVANLLHDSMRKRFESVLGNFDDMSILTSKEYVKIRERMNYGDEWSEGNWLASNDYKNWWILSDQNDKVFVVTSRGTFILTNPSKSYFIRPTLVINKDLVTKLEEKKEITMDLINGLKRK